MRVHLPLQEHHPFLVQLYASAQHLLVQQADAGQHAVDPVGEPGQLVTLAAGVVHFQAVVHDGVRLVGDMVDGHDQRTA